MAPAREQTQNLPDCLNCHLQQREREERVYHGRLEGDAGCQNYKIFLELLNVIDGNSTLESLPMQMKSIKHRLDTK